MEEIRSFFSEPIVGTLCGILGIVIGIIVATFFYYKSKIISKPCYSIESTILIDLTDNKIPNDVKINYNGEEIERLNRTVIHIWNAGRKVILQDELSPNNIKIQLKNGEILKVGRKTTSKHTTITEPTYNKDSFEFSFNFLEYKDRISFQIFHTGQNASFDVIGHVIGSSDFINASEKFDKVANLAIELVSGSLVDIFSAYVRFVVSLLSFRKL